MIIDERTLVIPIDNSNGSLLDGKLAEEAIAAGSVGGEVWFEKFHL